MLLKGPLNFYSHQVYNILSTQTKNQLESAIFGFVSRIEQDGCVLTDHAQVFNLLQVPALLNRPRPLPLPLHPPLVVLNPLFETEAGRGGAL